jgi:hypothetical protein
MRSALAGLRASPDFSFDNFGLRPKSSSRFGHGKTSHNPSRYMKKWMKRHLMILITILLCSNLQAQNDGKEIVYLTAFTGYPEYLSLDVAYIWASEYEKEMFGPYLGTSISIDEYGFNYLINSGVYFQPETKWTTRGLISIRLGLGYGLRNFDYQFVSSEITLRLVLLMIRTKLQYPIVNNANNYSDNDPLKYVKLNIGISIPFISSYN